MSAIFLSASVPQPGRGDYYKSASPYLIQYAVREFLLAALGRRLIVWGGHPAITPMVWATCEDLGVGYAQSVMLYQSRFFGAMYPEENERFKNVVEVDAVTGDRDKSLLAMRTAMFAHDDFEAAVFIGGMDGILEEHDLFSAAHPAAKIIALAPPGGAARDLAVKRGEWQPNSTEDLNFARLFHEKLSIDPSERRHTVVP